MSNRYILNTLSLVAGAALLVASRVFTGNRLEWVGFGVSAVVLIGAVTGLTIATRQRHVLGFGVLAAAAAWSAAAALIFTGTTLAWLVFADALAIALIALAALVVHEFTTERVVHTLEVRQELELQTL